MRTRNTVFFLFTVTIAIFSSVIQAQTIGNGTIHVTGGVLANQALSSSSWEISVDAGQTITGTVNISTNNLMISSAVAPFGYTWTWGPRETAVVEVNDWIPTGVTNWSVPISLTAPSEDGVYYILFGFNGEYNMSQVMSCHNWAAPTPIIWNDGNDYHDLDETRLEFAHINGYAQEWEYYFSSGRTTWEIPVAPIKIIVGSGNNNTYVSDCDSTVQSSYDGETIVVTNDIYTESEASCLLVLHNDVTVDCQGYRVTSATPPVGTSAVFAIGHGIRVQNCEFNGWAAGVYFFLADGGSAINNRAFENDIGILVGHSNHVEVLGNTLKENVRSGIQIFESSNIDVFENTVRGTGYTDFTGLTFAGITVFQSQGCYIADNVTNQNKLHGIRLFNEADSNYVLNNTSNNNGRDGITIESSANGNAVNGNVANRNSRYGIGNFDLNSFDNNVCRKNETADSFPDGNCK